MGVLVTGAAGFVGGHLVPRLRLAGFDVSAIDREVDVGDARAVDARLAELKPDSIVHLAAQSSVAVSWKEPDLTYRVNFLGARAILQAALRHCPRARILLVGSADQYGWMRPGARPLGEEAPLRPASPYARTKAAADLLGASYVGRGLDVIRVRAFNHFGPGQPDAFVLSSFARQIAEIEIGRRAPVLRVGNLDSVRDFLDVVDVVDAYVRLLDRTVPADAYNVASGAGLRIGELLARLLDLASVQPSVEPDPERHRPTDCSVGDAGRLRQATGWTPRVPLSRSLEGLLRHWRSEVSRA